MNCIPFYPKLEYQPSVTIDRLYFGSVNRLPVSGYVRINQVQAAYIGSGNPGKGSLDYHGDTYPFTVGGPGVGGIGIPKIEAFGEVRGVEHLRELRWCVGPGSLWLRPGRGQLVC